MGTKTTVSGRYTMTSQMARKMESSTEELGDMLTYQIHPREEKCLLCLLKLSKDGILSWLALP